MAKAEMTITINATNIPRVVAIIRAALILRAAVDAYGRAKLRCERIARDGDPLPGEWMRVVEAHDAFVALGDPSDANADANPTGESGTEWDS